MLPVIARDPKSSATTGASSGKIGRACKACHDDKCKCDFTLETQTKCDRCLKQNRPCIPRISRQGQRKPKNPNPTNNSRKSPPLMAAATMKNPRRMNNSLEPKDSTKGTNAHAVVVQSADSSAATASHKAHVLPALQQPSDAASSLLQALYSAKAVNTSMPSIRDGVNQSAVAAVLKNVLSNPCVVQGLNGIPNQGGLTAASNTPASLLTNQDLSGLLPTTSVGPASHSSINNTLFPTQTPVPVPVSDTLANLMQIYQQQQQKMQVGLNAAPSHQAQMNWINEQSGQHQGPLGSVQLGEQSGQHQGPLDSVQLGQGAFNNIAPESKLDKAFVSAELLRLRKKQGPLPPTLSDNGSLSGICSSDGGVMGTRQSVDYQAMKRSSSNSETSFHDMKPKSKKPRHRMPLPSFPQVEQQVNELAEQFQHQPQDVKQENSIILNSVQQSCQPQPASRPNLNSQGQAIDPELVLAKHLVSSLVKPNTDVSSLKNHFGVQALVREWIALSISRRSFGLLTKASDLAIKFGMSMDRILSGVDDDGTAMNCIGGQMNYLLPMLLEPSCSAEGRSKKNHRMLNPHLPRSLLKHIAPRHCTSFGELNVGNRWIMIRETCQGHTKFYCSPMFDNNVLQWARMSQIYEDNLADIFSLVFTSRQYVRVLEQLAQQVCGYKFDDGNVSPAFLPVEIRLLEKSWRDIGSENDAGTVVAKEMIGSAAADVVPTIQVEMMLAIVQTMDSQLVYMEFYNHKDWVKGSNQSDSIPPSYNEVSSQR